MFASQHVSTHWMNGSFVAEHASHTSAGQGEDCETVNVGSYMMRYLLLATTCGLLGAGPIAHAAGLRHVAHVQSSIAVLDEIGFVEDSATLTDASRRTLADVARTLTGNPELRLEVQSSLRAGITECIAHRRAAAVRAYLDTHGVEDGRLATRVVPAHDGVGIELILAD